MMFYLKKTLRTMATILMALAVISTSLTVFAPVSVKAFTSTDADEIFSDFNNKYYTLDDDIGRFKDNENGGTPAFGKLAEIIEVVEDAYDRTQDEDYEVQVEQLMSGVIADYGEIWTDDNSYNDAVMWMVLASERAYEITGDTDYLDYAQDNFDSVWDRAYDDDGSGPLDGGLWWSTSMDMKASNLSGAAVVAAVKLYNAGRGVDDEYLDKAAEIYDWMKTYLVYPDSGKVINAWTATGGYDTASFTNNQGVFIGAACELYLETSESGYLADAVLSADFAKNSMCYVPGGILQDESDTEEQFGFKGTFPRYIEKLMVECEQSQYIPWIQFNAQVVLENREPEGLSFTRWGRILPDSSNNLDSYGCSGGVALLQNCPPGGEYPVKNTLDTIQAEACETRTGMFVQDCPEGGKQLGWVVNGTYAVYRNVDFGTGGVFGFEARASVNDAGGGGYVAIRLDSLSGTQLGSCEITGTGSLSTFGTYSCSLNNTTVTGVHDVYLVFTTLAEQEMVLNWFNFVKTTSTLTGPGEVTGIAEFGLDYGLENATDIRAQDITVSYDKDMFDFVGVTPLLSGTTVVDSDNDTEAGTVRLILASTGEGNAINGDADVLELFFTPKTEGVGIFEITGITLADGSGTKCYPDTVRMQVSVQYGSVLEAAINVARGVYNQAEEGIENGQYPSGTKSMLLTQINLAQAVMEDPEATEPEIIQAAEDMDVAVAWFRSLVITSTTGDANGDDGVDLADLGIIANIYGRTAATDPNWSSIADCDINADEEIGLYELAFVARRILSGSGTNKWQQEKFIIGAYDGVRLMGNPEEDMEILQTFSEAGFNMMVGTHYWYTTREFDESGTSHNPNAVSNKYILELMADFNDAYGKEKLRLITSDKNFSFGSIPVNQPYSAESFSEYLSLSPDLREVLYGYNILDEPELEKLRECLPAINSLTEIDKKKMVFVNLGNTGEDFRDTARELAENSSMLSFDNYHWITGDDTPSKRVSDVFFRFAQIMAEEAKRAGVPWWGVPLSIEHEKRGENMEILWGFKLYDPDNRNPKTELARFRFNAYDNIIYGAKGVVWYLYDTSNNPITNPGRIEPFRDPYIPYSFHDGCLNYDGEPSIFYDYVKEVNTKLTSMGPILMDLTWLTTVHGLFYNNYPDTPAGTLPVVNQNTPVIASMSMDSTLAVGIFEGKDRNKYLTVLNKDIENDKTYTINLRNNAQVYQFNSNTQEWEEKELSAPRSVVLDVETGDMELLKIVEQ